MIDKMEVELVQEWMKLHGFVQSPECLEFWDTVYSHTDGHSRIGFGIMQHDSGWWIILRISDERMNIGTCYNLAQIHRTYKACVEMNFDADKKRRAEAE